MFWEGRRAKNGRKLQWCLSSNCLRSVMSAIMWSILYPVIASVRKKICSSKRWEHHRWQLCGNETCEKTSCFHLFSESLKQCLNLLNSFCHVNLWSVVYNVLWLLHLNLCMQVQNDCLSSVTAFAYGRVCTGGHTQHQRPAAAADFHVVHIQDAIYAEAEST